ncbi:MAG TPA: TetR/AcrR family transcriptional regulator C-terminal domain-containing protein [Acidimicrobiales bacterium]|nr:TetR/AcrR family transcriptional regulator C-terminal domain-containing protein [Acidimicrobiales bacterium]
MSSPHQAVRTEPGPDPRRSAERGPDLPLPPKVPRRERPGGRRLALTQEAVVAAAIEVLDEAGVAGLSMRRVADHLHVGVASIYAHVTSKDELLELVFDALVGQVPLEEPNPSRWREQVHKMLWDLRNILASHTDAALAGLGRLPTSPQTLAAAETLAATLRAGGLPDRVIALGMDQLVLYVSACAFEAGLFQRGASSPEQLERYFADAHAFYAALPVVRFPVLTEVAPDMLGHDAAERFEFGISVLLAGLEAAR